MTGAQFEILVDGKPRNKAGLLLSQRVYSLFDVFQAANRHNSRVDIERTNSGSNESRKKLPPAGAVSGLNIIATPSIAGAISLSRPTHFPPIPDSTLVNPVTLPPGRDRLVTRPAPTGSETAPAGRKCHRSELVQRRPWGEASRIGA